MKNKYSVQKAAIRQSVRSFFKGKLRRVFTKKYDTRISSDDFADVEEVRRLSRRAAGLWFTGRTDEVLKRLEEIGDELERTRALRQILFSDEKARESDKLEELLRLAELPFKSPEYPMVYLERAVIYARLGRDEKAASEFSAYLDGLLEIPHYIFRPEQLFALLYQSGGFEGMGEQLDRLAEIFITGAQKQGILALEDFAVKTLADLFLLGREDLLEYYWNYIFLDELDMYTLDEWMHQLFIPGILLCEYLDKPVTASYWLRRYLDLYEKRRITRELTSPYIPLVFDYIRRNYPELLEGRELREGQEANGEQQKKREEASSFFPYSRMILLVQMGRYEEAEEVLSRLPRDYMEKFGSNIEEAMENRTVMTVSRCDFARFLFRLVQSIAEVQSGLESRELHDLVDRILRNWLERVIPADRGVESVLRQLSSLPSLSEEVKREIHAALRLYGPDEEPEVES